MAWKASDSYVLHIPDYAFSGPSVLTVPYANMKVSFSLLRIALSPTVKRTEQLTGL